MKGYWKNKKRSSETKKKISETLKKKGIKPKKTPEVLAKISKALKGKKLLEETKRKISKAHKGKKLSKEHIEKMRGKIPWNKGLKGVYGTSRKGKSCWWKKGKRSPWWKGGITPLQLHLRHCFKYRLWRSDIFTRDDFTCWICNERGGKLEAHHIEAFAKILEKYKIKTFNEALDCEELWNINNGITLCKKCHKTYG